MGGDGQVKYETVHKRDTMHFQNNPLNQFCGAAKQFDPFKQVNWLTQRNINKTQIAAVRYFYIPLFLKNRELGPLQVMPVTGRLPKKPTLLLVFVCVAVVYKQA